jgi:SAM-dependent MidA family methyltransferase
MRTFRDFMESALYDPERGYYPRRRPRADFYTAPELHPAFAGVLARRVEELCLRGGLDAPKVVEMGAGEGLLAEQLLNHLPDDTHYTLVERSKPCLEAALKRLRAKFPNVVGARSLAELKPGPRVFVSNELVDAFPVHVLMKDGDKVREIYVDDAGNEHFGDFSTPELEPHASKVAETLLPGQRHAVNLEGERWIAHLGRLITHGAVVTVDYGHKFGAGVVNAPRAYYKHTLPDDLTARAGEQDLTASVDFSSLMDAGTRAGFKVEYFGTLSRFLIDGGIADFMPTGDSAADVRERAQIKTLIHPEGMGEVFKVLIQTHNEGLLS